MLGSSVEICGKCGYYARLNTFVDIDPSYGDASEDGPPKPAPQRSHLQVWLDLVPRWAYVLVAVNVFVIAISAIVACMVPNGTALRIVWSVSQLFLGIAVLVVAHILAYMTAVMQSDRVPVLDIVIRPISCWLPVFRQLPKTIKRVCFGSGAITAILMSFLVIGNLPYEMLWDWGVKPPPKQNLIGAVIAQANKIKKDKEMELEEALAELSKNTPTDEKAKAEPEPRENVDCVIVGYVPTKDDSRKFMSLVLASLVGNDLKVVGMVSGGIAPEDYDQLCARLPELTVTRPVVESTLDAVWLQPVLTCRVSCKKINKEGRLVDPRFESRMSDIKLD